MSSTTASSRGDWNSPVPTHVPVHLPVTSVSALDIGSADGMGAPEFVVAHAVRSDSEATISSERISPPLAQVAPGADRNARRVPRRKCAATRTWPAGRPAQRQPGYAVRAKLAGGLIPHADAVREVVAGDGGVTGGLPERAGAARGGLVGAEERDIFAEMPVHAGAGLGAEPQRGVHARAEQARDGGGRHP